MTEKVIVVTGAFATHTTKLYNYYVCPTSYDLLKVRYVAVNYMGELKYLGEIIDVPLQCVYNQEGSFQGLNGLSDQIKVDLIEFNCKLNLGEFQLVTLNPIIGSCSTSGLIYKGSKAFVRSHSCFENLAEFFSAHQQIN